MIVYIYIYIYIERERERRSTAHEYHDTSAGLPTRAQPRPIHEGSALQSGVQARGVSGCGAWKEKVVGPQELKVWGLRT